MLFTLYTNDFPTVTKFSNIESYVDDTKIYLSCASNLENMAGFVLRKSPAYKPG